MDYRTIARHLSGIKDAIKSEPDAAKPAYDKLANLIIGEPDVSALTSLIQATPQLMAFAARRDQTLAADLFISMNTAFETGTGAKTGAGIILTEHFAVMDVAPETGRATWFIPSVRKLPSGDELNLNICNDRFVANIHDILRQVKRIAPSLESHYGQVIIQARTVSSAWKRIADIGMDEAGTSNELEALARKMERRGKSVTVMDFPGPVPKPR